MIRRVPVLPLAFAIAVGACQSPPPPKSPVVPAQPVVVRPNAESAVIESNARTTPTEPSEALRTDDRERVAVAPEVSARRPDPTIDGVARRPRPDEQRVDTRADPDVTTPALAVASPPARSLAGRNFWQDGQGTSFRSLHFLENLVAATTVDGQLLLLPADYSATHVECMGYPTCVLATQPDGGAMVFQFALQEDTLFPVVCNTSVGLDPVDWVSLGGHIRSTMGTEIVYDANPTICYNARATPYREVPATWTPRDEAEYRFEVPPTPQDPALELAAPPQQRP